MTNPNDYTQGFADGERDGQVIASPVHTNGHTESAYLTIKARYEEAIYAFPPSAYQRGYGDGLDAVAARAQEERATVPHDHCCEDCDGRRWGCNAVGSCDGYYMKTCPACTVPTWEQGRDRPERLQTKLDVAKL